MGKSTAVIILNRNLPEVTDRLVQVLFQNNADTADVYVVEAGSDEDKLSEHCSWWADWEEARRDGLRTPRGFNYGLLKLWEEGRFYDYDYYFLLTNDTEFKNGQPVVSTLIDELQHHSRVGIISPCSRRWGERLLLRSQKTRYFWYILNTAYLLRREYVESIMETVNPSYMNFLYDGTNFRGYGCDSELVIKGYANDWAAAITTSVWAEENESYLREQADLIKTDSYDVNLNEYIEEGKRWMRRKYGFNSRWTMQMYAKFMYEKFFEFHPDLREYMI